MSLSNKEVYDYLNNLGLIIEPWGAKGTKGSDKKALKCIFGRHVFYIKVNSNNYPLVFDPITTESTVELLDKVQGCEVGKEMTFSTAFQTFDKKINQGKTPTNYGYHARFDSYEALDEFFKTFSGNDLEMPVDVDVQVFQFSRSDLDHIDEIENIPNLSDTDRDALVKIRIGQSKFRDNLKKHWGGCAVTDCTHIVFLIASHIRPWSKCKDEPEHRLNKFNGLLLTPNLDKLFDLGLISFQDKGQIIISATVRLDDYVSLGINLEMRLRDQLQQEHLQFLQYHREHILKV